MKRLRIIIDQEGWCLHNRALALQKYAPADWEVDIVLWRRHLPAAGHDVNFLLNGDRIAQTRQDLPDDAVIVSSWNTGWPRDRDRMRDAIAHADAIVAISWHAYLAPDLANAGIILGGPGVDRSIFYPTTPPLGRAPRVLWCAGVKGSNEKRQYLKGYQRALDLVEPLAESGITMDIRAVDPHGGELYTQAEMRDWYSTGRVLVVTSDMEGVPNVALESAACGCAVVSTDVGVMRELVGSDWRSDGGPRSGWVVSDPKFLLGAVCWAIGAHEWMASAGNMEKNIGRFDWAEVAPGYFGIFDSVLEVHDARNP